MTTGWKKRAIQSAQEPRCDDAEAEAMMIKPQSIMHSLKCAVRARKKQFMARSEFYAQRAKKRAYYHCTQQTIFMIGLSLLACTEHLRAFGRRPGTFLRRRRVRLFTGISQSFSPARARRPVPRAPAICLICLCHSGRGRAQAEADESRYQPLEDARTC